MPVRPLLLLFLLLGSLLPSVARAQSTDKSKPEKPKAGQAKPEQPKPEQKPEKRNEPAKKGSGITPEREAAVMTFVKLNHSDLEMLLTHLKQSDAKEYEKAIRELMRVIDRLASIKERDTEMYELELRIWKSQSRLQLLSARQSMGPAEDLRDEMREVLNEQGDVRAEILRREKQRVQERLTKIDAELSRLEAGRERWIEQQLKLAGAASGNESNKPAASKPAEAKATSDERAESKETKQPASSSATVEARPKEPTPKRANKPGKPTTKPDKP